MMLTLKRVKEDLDIDLVYPERTAPYPAHGDPVTGADPELFILKGDKVRSSRRWWTVDEKFHVSSATGEKQRMISDNVLLELQPTPASCLSWTQDGLGRLIKEATKTIGDDTIRLVPYPALPVPQVELKRGGMEFGCSPAWRVEGTEIVPVRPLANPKQCDFRSAGYHVHLGAAGSIATRGRQAPRGLSVCNVLHGRDEIRVALIHVLDATLGVFSTIMEHYLGWYTPATIRRREVGYGLAGEYRDQPHGVEYRVLSPWPMLHPTLMHLAHYWARSIVYAVSFDAVDLVLNEVDRGEVESAINNVDTALALKVLRRVKKNLNVIDKVVTRAGVDKQIADLEHRASRATQRPHQKGYYETRIAALKKDRLNPEYPQSLMSPSCPMTDREGTLDVLMTAIMKGNLFKKLFEFHGGNSFPELWSFPSHKLGIQSFSEERRGNKSWLTKGSIPENVEELPKWLSI